MEFYTSGQNQTRTRVDTWYDVGHTSNLSSSWDKRGIRAKNSPFSGFDREREEKREEGKRRSKLPPTIRGVPWVGFCISQEQKFVALTRGKRGHLKIGISSKIQEGRFREIEVVGFRRFPTRLSCA